MKQHAVPENIMDVEFKLFGSLTAKQFGYIIAGGGVGLFFFYLFKSLGSSFLGIIFAFLSVVLGLSLALIRINEQPFEIWLGNFLAAMFSSQKRVWRKSRKVPDALKEKDEMLAAKDENRGLPSQLLIKPRPKPSKIEAPVKQSKPDEVSVPAHPFKDMRKDVAKEVKKEEVRMSSEPQRDATVAGEEKKTDGFFVPGSAQGFVGITNNQQSRPLGATSDVSSTTQTGTSVPQASDSLATGLTQIFPQDANSNPISSPSDKKSSTQLMGDDKISVPSKDGKIELQKSVDEFMATDSSDKTKGEGILVKEEPKEESLTSENKHVNLATQLGDILPSREEVLGQAALEKASDAQPSEELVDEENEKLRQKLATFSEDKSRLEQELGQEKRGREELEAKNREIVTQLEQLRSEMEALKTEKKPEAMLPQEPVTPVQQLPSEEEVSRDVTLLSPKVYDGPSLSKKPNVVSGIVKTRDGNLLPGVVVIIKNDKGRPVRAMKTNSLGQFVTTTALENGTFEVELTKAEYSFGSYEISLTGELVPTYEFVAE